MRIRTAIYSDLAAAAELRFDRLALLQQTDTRIRALPNARAIWTSRAKVWIDSEEAALFVAKNEKLLGFIALTITNGRPGLEPERLGIVMDMAVDLHQTHRELSGRLLETAQAWLRSKEIAMMEINAPARYPVEEAFWRSRDAKLVSRTYWLAT